MAAKTQDLNHMAYDAPLGIKQPWYLWTLLKAHQGANNKTLSTEQMPEVSPAGKWVIITGSNNGIGREAALQMAEWGANLILACRDPPSKEIHPKVVVEECLEKARAAGHKIQVEWWEIDMANLDTVEAFAQRWLDTGRPLDILANNAGIGSSPGGAKVFKTKDGWEIVHQINFTSHVLLTLRLLPSLAKAREPRIICTTSCFHYLGNYNLKGFNGEAGTGLSGVQLYMNNKLWYQTWLTELQHRLLQHQHLQHITINGVHPGYVNTGIWNLNARAPFSEWAVKALAWWLAITPQQGSFAITNAATSFAAGPNLELQGVGDNRGLGGGSYFNRIWPDEPMPHTTDRDCRLRVWRKVNDELGLQSKGLLDTLGLEANDL